MKALRTFVLVAVIGIAAVGCNKVEKILPKKDGLWVAVSMKLESFLNDSLVESVTETYNLGQFFFAKDGTGYTAEFDGSNRSSITWSVNDDNDQITIADSVGGDPITIDILESGKDAMTWFYIETDEFLGDEFRGEVTLDIERK